MPVYVDNTEVCKHKNKNKLNIKKRAIKNAKVFWIKLEKRRQFKKRHDPQVLQTELIDKPQLVEFLILNDNIRQHDSKKDIHYTWVTKIN